MIDEQKKLRANLWKYWISIVSQKSYFWPILTIFFLSFPNNTARQIGFFTAIGEIVGFGLEIPTGYFADKFGHKRTLVIAKICSIISDLFFIVGGNFWFFALGSGFMTASISFNSGTNSAFMHETLSGLGQESLYSKIIGRISSTGFWFSAPFLALIPLTAKFNLRYPIIVDLVITLIGTIAVLSLYQPKKDHRDVAEIRGKNFKAVMHEAIKYDFFKVILLVEGFDAVLLGVSAYRDVYQVSLGVTVALLGIWYAMSRVFAGVVSHFSYLLKKKFSLEQYIVLKTVVLIPAIVLIGLIPNKFFVIPLFILVIGAYNGLLQVNAHYELEYIKGSKFKATLMSFGGQIQFLGYFFTSLLIGFIIGQYSYSLGYVYYGLICLVPIAIIITFVKLRPIKPNIESIDELVIIE